MKNRGKHVWQRCNTFKQVTGVLLCFELYLCHFKHYFFRMFSHGSLLCFCLCVVIICDSTRRKEENATYMKSVRISLILDCLRDLLLRSLLLTTALQSPLSSITSLRNKDPKSGFCLKNIFH